MVIVEDIGLSLFFGKDGEYVVSYILADSLASEYEKIQVGDVVHEVDSVALNRKTVAAVNQLLNSKTGTIAMTVSRTKKDSTMESNLVIMVRPSLAPSPSPLAKARQSMMHPDVSELISSSDLHASMAAQPSFEVSCNISISTYPHRNP